ncbi:MAG: carbamoyltransferase [Flavobacteriales bacterium]
MKILGISAYYHDAAAALLSGGSIVAAAQEERFTRIKHDASFPHHAVRYCLEQGGLTLDELDAVVFYDKPLLKFERLLETYYRYAPAGFASFIKAMPVWLKDKMMLKKLLRDELKSLMPCDKKFLRLLFPEHHLSHAASAFFPSPFEEAAILTVDGVGEWATASIAHGKDGGIRVVKELPFPHSVGLLYSAFTYYLGFRVNSGEYKLMGLAPYGNRQGQRVQDFVEKIRSRLLCIGDDGSVRLEQSFFSYATGLRMTRDTRWEKLFGLARRKPETEIEQAHCDLALAIQIVTEEIVLKMAEEARKVTGSGQLCLAGGVALNCVANGRLLRKGLFREIYIQPAAGDAGGALGAALAAQHIYFGCKRQAGTDAMRGAYLGPDFSEKVIRLVLDEQGARYTKLDRDALCDAVAGRLAEGEVVGWFQGRMEFGPRALGNRSILADPRNTEMQKKLNLKIKYRESFRPFAPSVLSEERKRYFELQSDSPYMLLVADVADEIRKPLPEDYDKLTLKQKRCHQHSEIPAVTHVDFSARVQTVHREINPIYWQLIDTFRRKTGCALLVNTSFNVRGEPIVCTPADAYHCFMNTEMDWLAIGPFLLDKRQQPIASIKAGKQLAYQSD